MSTVPAPAHGCSSQRDSFRSNIVNVHCTCTDQRDRLRLAANPPRQRLAVPHPLRRQLKAMGFAKYPAPARAPCTMCWQRESTARVAGGCEGRGKDGRIRGFGAQASEATSVGSDTSRSSTSGATEMHNRESWSCIDAVSMCSCVQ